MSNPTLVVTIEADEDRRIIITDSIGDAGEVIFLADVPDDQKPAAVANANAIFASHVKQLPDLGRGISLDCKLLQFYSAGVDFLPLKQLADSLPIAGNGGAFAEPMAEHGLAMALAAGKRLAIEHNNMKVGEFNQFTRNKLFLGGVAGIVGFGGIGVQMAKLFKGIGMQIHAINRRASTDENVDWIGGPPQLDDLLAASDVVVLSMPLSKETENLFNARRLSYMKPDAILINLARGQVIDENALYAHLQENPEFVACLDTWWSEPERDGEFKLNYPFFDLPNVIGSPHNSASVGVWRRTVVRRATENCARALRGETPWHLIKPEERML